MFTIGAFARAAGVSAKMLRAWDELGLFSPAWSDPVSRYRYYSPAQLPELRRVLALRDIGMPLADIRALVRGGSDLRAALERRRTELEATRRDAERRLAALEIQVDLAADGASGPDVVVRTIGAQLVATFDLRLRADGDVGHAFYELEAYVRDARARAHLPPGAIPDERQILVPLRRAVPTTDRIGIRRLEACRAVTILHRGDYDTLPETHLALRRWLDASGERQVAPLRVLYLQFGAEADLELPRGWVVERPADFVTELQLPIEAGASGRSPIPAPATGAGSRTGRSG